MTDALTPGRLIRDTLREQRIRIGGAALLLMAWQACESLVPVSIGAIIQQAIGAHDGSRMAWWIVILAVQFLVLSFSFRFGSRVGRSAMEYAGHSIRLRITRSLLDPRRMPDRGHRAGVTVAIAGSDVDRVAQFCQLVPRVAGALLSVVIAAVVLLRLSVQLGVVVLVGAPVLLALVHLLGGPLERRSGTEQEHSARSASLATDLMEGLRVLKGFRGERAADARYRTASREAMTASLRAARAQAAYESTAMLATVCFLALVALIGGRLAAEGTIGVGDLVAAVGLAQFLIGPLAGLSSTGAAFSRVRASSRRIAGVLNAPRRTDRAAPDAPTATDLSVNTDSGELRVAPGELVGVVGDQHASSQLIDRLDDAAYLDDDAVRIGGVPASELGPTGTRRIMLVARHDEAIFADSVIDNVRGGRPVDEKVRRAVAASTCDQVADMLPDGLDSLVGERGSALSGGQRQRVMLARALSADPPILVLHDPTTAVDAVTEARIAEGLADCRAGRSTLVVTTSPALLAVCDRVVHLTDGGPVIGDHTTLLQEDSAYRERVLA